MSDKTAKQWAFIFHQFGKEQLRQMLFKAAMHKDEEGRTIIEFDGDQALNITDHVAELEEKIENGTH